MTVQTMLLALSEGFVTTLAIFAVTIIGSMPLGIFVYFGKVSRIAPIRWIVEIYISIIRGTPLMLQLMVVYFGPNLIFGVSLPSNWRFIAVAIAFIINYAAYFAEIYRSGFEAIPKGQYEAAEVLGYTKVQRFMKIIIPQMIRNTLPSITNELITLVKDTSLASIIGTMEMFTRAKQIAVAPHTPGMWAFVAAAVFYYVFNYIVAIIMAKLEKKFQY